jgi:hypothetical protein
VADERVWDFRAECSPFRRRERGGEMAAGGMPAHRKALPVLTVQEECGATNILDDVRNADLRAKTIFDHCNGIPTRVRAPRPVAEHRDVERAPIAAVQDKEKRSAFILAVRSKEVNDVAPVRPVRDAEISAPGTRAPICGGIALPSRNDVGMLGDPSAIVVFGLEVDCAQALDLFQRLSL